MTVVHDAPSTHATTATELLRAAAAGDQDAWRVLLERYEPIVASALFALRLQPADLRDAMQCTWLRMVECHREIREPEALGGWLRTTARREGLKVIRSRRRLDPLESADGHEFRDGDVDIEQSVVDADTVARVRSLVDVLPPRSAALVHQLFQDTPPGYAEIARETGIPIGSIGPTRGRALERLRRMFEDGVQPSEFARGA